MGPDRRQREKAGRNAERTAVWLLRLKGYRVLARRFRAPVGEIDVVVRRGRTLAFVEVKARASEAEALSSVTPRQQERIRRAAEVFVQRHASCSGLDMRFDVVAVTPGALPRHHPDAWRES